MAKIFKMQQNLKYYCKYFLSHDQGWPTAGLAVPDITAVAVPTYAT